MPETPAIRVYGQRRLRKGTSDCCFDGPSDLCFKGDSHLQRSLREKGITSDVTDHFLMDALFCTITNANFDDAAITGRIDKGFALKKDLVPGRKERDQIPDMPEVTLEAAPADYQVIAQSVGVLSESNEDIRSLKQMTIYGLKGMAAYAEHALNLGHKDPDIHAFMEEALYQVSRNDIAPRACCPGTQNR